MTKRTPKRPRGCHVFKVKMKHEYPDVQVPKSNPDWAFAVTTAQDNERINDGTWRFVEQAFHDADVVYGVLPTDDDFEVPILKGFFRFDALNDSLKVPRGTIALPVNRDLIPTTHLVDRYERILAYREWYGEDSAKLMQHPMRKGDVREMDGEA